MGDRIFIGPVDDVIACWCSLVAFLGFVTFWVAAHGNVVGTDDFTVPQRHQSSVTFINENDVSLLVLWGHRGRGPRALAQHNLSVARGGETEEDEEGEGFEEAGHFVLFVVS